MSGGNQKNNRRPIERVAAFIVDKRRAFYLLYIGLAIFCAFSSGWVKVNTDITGYLPADTETRRGLILMEEEFISYGSSRVMVDNITYAEAEALSGRLSRLPGVQLVEFDGSEAHYKGGAALFSVTYEGTVEDRVSLDALEKIRETLSGYDVYVAGDTGESISDSLNEEVKAILLLAVVIILLVLLFTSRTYMEIPVLLLTFGLAAVLNKGSNFILGEVSFISDSVSVVLQLALAIDYAIILCHRYTEERERMEARDAVVTALSKAIPEISGSCLTTLAGLAAMCFMQFGIGRDLGLVMMKAIFLSLVSVFTFMPGLLLSFSKLIDRSHHRNFVPKITVLGKAVVKTRYILPPLFVVLVVGGFIFSNKCPFAYGQSDLTTFSQNEGQIAEAKINDTFGSTNMLAILVPVGDYEREARLLRELGNMPEVDSALGLANIEAMDGYVLTDTLTPREFSELTELDIQMARLLYSAYAVDQESYGQLVSGVDSLGVPLIDMFLFIHDQMEEGYVTLDGGMGESIDELYSQLTGALGQLKSDKHSRLVLQLNLPEEGEETFAFLDTLHAAAARYYDDVVLVGGSTSASDLSASFVFDNLLISILTIIFVILVLIFTFRSAGLPVLLIMVIQGSVWINFSFPYLMNDRLFFLGYLVVSAIQMGANIDYAIVIATRYTQLKRVMPLKEAVIESLNEAFPTIVTSGTIMASASLLIGVVSTMPAIAPIGVCLGRGTLISIFLVMVILPQLLLLGDLIIEKTAFTLVSHAPTQSKSGSIRVNGRVRGYVSGMVNADINGVVYGSVNATVEAGALEEQEPEAVAAAADERGGEA